MCSYIYLIKHTHKIPSEKIDEFTNIILQTAKYEIGVEQIKKWLKKNVIKV
jgi:hypothetical protein